MYTRPWIGSVAGSRPASSQNWRSLATAVAMSIGSRPGISNGIQPSALRTTRRSTAIRSAAADHERDGVRRQWIDADAVELVEAALEVDERLGPQHAHHIDLLFEQRGAIGEVDAEAFVLRGVPTDTDGQADAPAAEQIDRRDLLGDHGGLALWQHQHAGDKAHVVVSAARWLNSTRIS